MKRVLCLILIVMTLLACVGCSEATVDPSQVTKLSFKSASSYSYLKSLDGTYVTINGYMATSSPVDGSFIFLMNLPYQSCPFCKPNTSELSNTMEVYPKSGKTFSYTAQAIKITGKLKVAATENDSFSDSYGYQFNFMITDAEYSILTSDDTSAEVQLWQKFANSDIINDIYKMYDYVNFVCNWPTYFVNTTTDVDGVVHPGYYLYASDALKYLQNDGAQWNYGYVDGYFDSLIAKVQKIDPTAFSALVQNIEKAKQLAADAVAELVNGNYSSKKEMVEKFGQEDYIFTLTNGEALQARMDEIYQEFTNWLGSWEL